MPKSAKSNRIETSDTFADKLNIRTRFSPLAILKHEYTKKTNFEESQATMLWKCTFPFSRPNEVPQIELLVTPHNLNAVYEVELCINIQDWKPRKHLIFTTSFN